MNVFAKFTSGHYLLHYLQKVTYTQFRRSADGHPVQLYTVYTHFCLLRTYVQKTCYTVHKLINNLVTVELAYTYSYVHTQNIAANVRFYEHPRRGDPLVLYSMSKVKKTVFKNLYTKCNLIFTLSLLPPWIFVRPCVKTPSFASRHP